jgi:hypothetical protein
LEKFKKSIKRITVDFKNLYWPEELTRQYREYEKTIVDFGKNYSKKNFDLEKYKKDLEEHMKAHKFELMGHMQPPMAVHCNIFERYIIIILDYHHELEIFTRQLSYINVLMNKIESHCNASN